MMAPMPSAVRSTAVRVRCRPPSWVVSSRACWMDLRRSQACIGGPRGARRLRRDGGTLRQAQEPRQPV